MNAGVWRDCRRRDAVRREHLHQTPWSNVNCEPCMVQRTREGVLNPTYVRSWSQPQERVRTEQEVQSSYSVTLC